MKKAFWAGTVARLFVYLAIIVVSASPRVYGSTPEDPESEAFTPGVAVVPYPTHMELILDRFLKDPGRFIGARIDANEYIVGPGDVFTVSFVSDDVADIGVRISATGLAFIKSVGAVQIDGMTLREALSAITHAVRGIYTRGDFAVQLAAFRFVRVDVVGEVATPGTYYVPAFWRASEAIELAGGLTPRAESRKIILRGDNRFAYLDMVRLEATGDISADPMISGGHTIVVPNRGSCADYVTVSGLVHRPGTFAVVDDDLVVDYLGYAGGVRGSLDEMDVFISNPVSGKSAVLSGALDTELEVKPGPGDNITVRWKEDRAWRGTVMIFGAVERPGRYPLPNTEYTVRDLLQASGGITGRGCPEMMRIYRIRPENMPTPELQSGYNNAEDADHRESPAMIAVKENRMAVSSNPRRPIDPTRFGLEDGDSLYIPHSTGMVSVVGAVASPGLVPYKKGQSVNYYLEEAGGLGLDADRDGMVVVNPITGGEIGAAGAGELFDGEIIFVPRKENNRRP